MAFRPDIIAGRAVILVSIEETINGQLRRLRGTMRQFANSFSTLGGDLFRFGVAGTIGAALPIRDFVLFQDQLLFLQTKLQATDREMKGLEQTIRQLGRTTSFSPKQVAEAATEFAKAGFTIEETTDSLQAALDLARGGAVDLSTATAILARTIRTFKLETGDSAEVASKFITAARLGTLNIVDLNESLKESSGTFKFLKVPLSDVLALITQLSNSSLIGTKAGTSLNTAYLNLTRNAEKLQSALGLKFTDLRNPVATFTELGKALEGLNEQEQVKVLADIFNIRGGRAATAVLIQGLANLDDRTRQISASFDEARISAKKLDSALGGVFRRAKSAFEEFKISVGSTAEGPLVRFGEGVRKFFINLSSFANTNPELLTTLLLIPPIALAAGGAMLLLASLLGNAANLLTPVIGAIALAFGALFSTIGFLGTGGGAALLGVGAFTGLLGTFRGLTAGIKGFGTSIKTLLADLGPSFELLSISITQLSEGRVKEAFDTFKTSIKDMIDLIKIELIGAWEDFKAETPQLIDTVTGAIDNMNLVINKSIKAIEKLQKLIGKGELGIPGLTGDGRSAIVKNLEEQIALRENNMELIARSRTARGAGIFGIFTLGGLLGGEQLEGERLALTQEIAILKRKLAARLVAESAPTGLLGTGTSSQSNADAAAKASEIVTKRNAKVFGEFVFNALRGEVGGQSIPNAVEALSDGLKKFQSAFDTGIGLLSGRIGVGDFFGRAIADGIPDAKKEDIAAITRQVATVVGSFAGTRQNLLKVMGDDNDRRDGLLGEIRDGLQDNQDIPLR